MLPWILDHANTLWNSFDWGKAANLAVVLAGFYTYLKVVKPMLRGVARFLEDWNGEAPRNGITARPGVMSRVQKLEMHNAALIESHIDKNKRIRALEEHAASTENALKRLEKLITPVHTYVKDKTGAIPTQESPAGSKG